MPWSRHLDDARLHECYFASAHGEAASIRWPPITWLSAAAAPHATGDLAPSWTGCAHDGVAETDAVFTPDRLAAQQQQIARRWICSATPPGSSRSRAASPRDAVPAGRVAAPPPSSPRDGSPPPPPRASSSALVVGSMYDFGVRAAAQGAPVACRARPAPQPPASTAPPASLARPVTRLLGRRGVPVADRAGPRRPADARAPAVRRDDSARAGNQHAAALGALPRFPQGARPQACRRRHAGRELPQRARRPDQGRGLPLPVRPAHHSPGPRVRLLLRRRPRRRLRVPDAAAVPGSRRLPDRRNHPQPARQREAAGAWGSAS